MLKTLDTPYVLLQLEEEDLLIGRYKAMPKFTLEIAKEVVRTRLQFTGPEPLVAIIYNDGVKSLAKDARNYLSSDEGIRGLIAAAYVLDNPFSSFIANFFISVSKAKLPIKVFTKKQSALNWLEKYRKKEKK